MKLQTHTCIEVENVPGYWAVDLNECKKEMNPLEVKFIAVNNSFLDERLEYIENILGDMQPTKTIDGVNGGIADNYFEVGFWRVKRKLI
jgi:hypothetical protein